MLKINKLSKYQREQNLDMSSQFYSHSLFKQDLNVDPKLVQTARIVVKSLISEKHTGISDFLDQSVKQIVSHGLCPALLAQAQLDRVYHQQAIKQPLVSVQIKLNRVKLENQNDFEQNINQNNGNLSHKSLKQKTSTDLNPNQDLFGNFQDEQSYYERLNENDIRKDCFFDVGIQEDISWF